jgi:hypothetical protein
MDSLDTSDEATPNPEQNPAQMAAQLAITLVGIGGVLVIAFRVFIAMSEAPAPEDAWQQSALAVAPVAVILVGMVAALASVLLVRRYGSEGVTSRAGIALGLAVAVFAGIAVANIVGGAGGRQAEKPKDLQDNATNDERSAQAKEMKRLFAAYSEAVAAFERGGGMTLETLGSIEAIEARQALLKNVVVANVEIDLKSPGGREKPEEEVAIEDMDVTQIVARMRELDHQYTDAAGEMLGLLRDHWGHWAMDGETHAVRFEANDAGDAFVAAAGRLSAVREERVALKAALAERQKQAKK